MTLPRFLIDENLSVKLPGSAHRRGFEATHVIHLGLGRWKDWDILDVVERQGWTLVTNDAIEFRSRYRRIELHPGSSFIQVWSSSDLLCAGQSSYYFSKQLWTISQPIRT